MVVKRAARSALFETGEGVRMAFIIERNERYERREDMSPDGKLGLIVQDDGDIIVYITRATDECKRRGGPPMAGVEFCTVGSGGGRSPHTRKALFELIGAIARDNRGVPFDG